MRPFELASNRAEQVPRVSHPMQLQKSDSVSPPAIIRNAPVKKGAHFSNGWSSSSSSAFSASQDSCNAREERCGKPNKHIRRLHEREHH